MTITAKRYAEVDRQLQQMYDDLVSLAGELGQTATPTDPFCQPCQAARKTAKRVAELRYLLAVAEARRQIGEQQQAPSPFALSARQPSASVASFQPQRTTHPPSWLTRWLGD
jgi:hypothetical protein